MGSRISPIVRAILRMGDPGNEAGRFAPRLRTSSVGAKELKFLSVRIFLEPVAARRPRLRGNEMASVQLQNPYLCDQCGTPEIVAVPLLYQQGTRTSSGPFGWGSSQSYSAHAAAPPRPRGYLRPLLLWGLPILLFFLWTFAGFSSILEHPMATATTGNAVVFFLLLGVACLGGLVFNLRRISRYNREIYPRLHWDWEHTYMCRRCGNFRLIPS